MTSFTDNDGGTADFELFPPEIAASCQQPQDAALHTLVEEVNRLGRLVLEGAAPSALRRAIDRVAAAVETVAAAEPNSLRSYLADFKPTGPAPDGYDPLLSRLVHWLTRQCLRVALESDPRLDSPDCPICTRLAEQALDRLRDRRHAHHADPGRRRAEDALAEHALDAIQAGCWEWNLQTQSSRVDLRYVRMLGYKPSALGSTRETSFSALLHPEDRPVFEEQLQAHFAHPEQPCSCLVRLRHGDGRWISLHFTGRVIEWDESGKPLRMAGLQQAVDPRTPERERGLICLHDHLTGLPNRVLLVEQLQHELAVATREKQPVVVIELAVADFDALRGQYGQAAADRLLTGLTGRMHETLRETTLMARVGEDRFVLVMRGLAEQAEATAIERLRAALRVPLDLDGHRRMPLQVAIGLSRHDPARQDRTTAEALLEQAQQALETAGRDDSGQWHAFDPETDRLARDRRRELERIRAGLSAAEFVLHYQPTVNLHSGEVISLEGLARWQHPELGLLAPARFIPLIEDDPLGIDFGRWEIETALGQIARWNAEGLHLNVSVNLSPQMVREPTFFETLQSLMKRHDSVRPGQLTLEIVESTALEETGVLGRLIDRCRCLGVDFSLDDFGTGYSSMNHLKRLGVATVKIDRSFVAGMLEDVDQLATVQSILRLAETFKRRASAEGVESELHGRMLLQLGCTIGQGFGIAGPMPAESLEEWLRTWTVPASWLSCPPLPEDKLPVLVAEVQHRAWFRALLQSLSGGHAATTPPLNDRECELGRWLHGAQDSGSLAQSEHLLDLEHQHRELHRRAVDAVHAVQGGAAVSDEKVAELTRLHQAMLTDLERLRGY